MKKLFEIEGIGETYQAKLIEIGVSTVEGLLEKGSTKKGRVELAEKSGISDKLLLKWINHADLFRIKGVAGEYAELLEAAGVDTVPELGNRNGDNLHAKLLETNEEKKLVRKLPSVDQVKAWIEQAKELPRVINY